MDFTYIHIFQAPRSCERAKLIWNIYLGHLSKKNYLAAKTKLSYIGCILYLVITQTSQNVK